MPEYRSVGGKWVPVTKEEPKTVSQKPAPKKPVAEEKKPVTTKKKAVKKAKE